MVAFGSTAGRTKWTHNWGVNLCLHVYHVPNYCKGFDKLVVTVQADVGVSVIGTALRRVAYRTEGC